ncbi:hypothetical protein B5X24_HaOG203656 [Helicoverpa armigera]|uniref:Uncharacterized protein n=1 Tax=Helicoverpa armigera TaxID=29058 RepID=A0A2W1BQB2_HELAM|nr:hypothetical protein B5X24_HaOG203656 [Helicoverpa armigera]
MISSWKTIKEKLRSVIEEEILISFIEINTCGYDQIGLFRLSISKSAIPDNGMTLNELVKKLNSKMMNRFEAMKDLR